jgi:hypothetical protein
MRRFTRDSFNLRDRIEGASAHSIILKGDNGEKIHISNKLFNKIINNPTIEFVVETLPAHLNPMTGHEYKESKWISAYLPSRF